MKKCLYAVFAFFFFSVSVVHAERGGTALNGTAGNSSVQAGSPSDNRNSVVSGASISPVRSVETPMKTTYFLSYEVYSKQGARCFVGNTVLTFPLHPISSGADLDESRKSLLAVSPAPCKKGTVHILFITRMPI